MREKRVKAEISKEKQ
uniref:Uncharacterized protein n=1 Tax=Rhizophora mucronata TaxID=61149 RepID=A0A2P2J0U2_RHIMU